MFHKSNFNNYIFKCPPIDKIEYTQVETIEEEKRVTNQKESFYLFLFFCGLFKATTWAGQVVQYWSMTEISGALHFNTISIYRILFQFSYTMHNVT